MDWRDPSHSFAEDLMVVLNAAGASTQRRIALVKPRFTADEQAGHAIQLFDSVLWVFKGTSRSTWQITAPDDAQVVVVHHSEPTAHVETWRRAGKRIIKVSTNAANHPAGPYTLLYPFPAVQVLSMLERVEAEIDGWSDEPTIAPATTPPNPQSTDPWSFVESLRTLRSLSNSTLWLECKGERGVSLWISGDGRRYFCDNSTAAAIRAGTIDLSGLTPNKSGPPPVNLEPRPGQELFWFATYHASAALAPWLEEKTSYRLLRWPDFGRVRASDEVARTAQIRICAALAATTAPIAAVAARTQIAVEQATRTMNALASCGLIEPATATIEPTRQSSHAPVPPGGLKQFLRNLRKHLGLGARE
jgi:hypothetical protein